MLTSHQASYVSPKIFLYIKVSLVKKLNQVSRLARTTMGQVFDPNYIFLSKFLAIILIVHGSFSGTIKSGGTWCGCGWWPHQSSMTTRLWMRDIDTGCRSLSSLWSPVTNLWGPGVDWEWPRLWSSLLPAPGHSLYTRASPPVATSRVRNVLKWLSWMYYKL